MALPKQSEELDLLKARASQMGIKHHPNIGLDKLRDKVANFQKTSAAENVQAAREALVEEEAEVPVQAVKTAVKEVVETKGQYRIRRLKEASRYRRIIVTNMNPNRKEWEGDIYTVSNSLVGTFKKYIPFNNEDGWHVPNIIYEHLKERKCQVFYTVKNRDGAKIRKGKLIPELNIVLLPDLTSDQLKELASQQAQRNSINAED